MAIIAILGVFLWRHMQTEPIVDRPKATEEVSEPIKLQVKTFSTQQVTPSRFKAPVILQAAPNPTQNENAPSSVLKSDGRQAIRVPRHGVGEMDGIFKKFGPASLEALSAEKQKVPYPILESDGDIRGPLVFIFMDYVGFLRDNSGHFWRAQFHWYSKGANLILEIPNGTAEYPADSDKPAGVNLFRKAGMEGESPYDGFSFVWDLQDNTSVYLMFFGDIEMKSGHFWRVLSGWRYKTGSKKTVGRIAMVEQPRYEEDQGQGWPSPEFVETLMPKFDLK